MKCFILRVLSDCRVDALYRFVLISTVCLFCSGQAREARVAREGRGLKVGRAVERAEKVEKAGRAVERAEKVAKGGGVVGLHQEAGGVRC